MRAAMGEPCQVAISLFEIGDGFRALAARRQHLRMHLNGGAQRRGQRGVSLTVALEQSSESRRVSVA